MDTRPTTDRIKETLFNMLQDELYDVQFLDLFSGSGGIGIEALSRGASRAWFVDSNREAVTVIRENLEKTRLQEQAQVLHCTAAAAVNSLAGKERFQVVFMDPPYGKGLEKELLALPAFHQLLDQQALIVIEADLETELTPQDLEGYRLLKQKRYKTNQHFFLEKL
jgi:16S rRNA (guanine966-N2)-methyltransferase